MTIAEQIIYEDNHLIAINKRCGQIVQGDKTGDVTLPDMIKAYLKERDGKPGNVFCGVIHRLDRPVSGGVLFAKTSKALSRMNDAVKQREMKKIYWAACKEAPIPPEGRLENWLTRNEKSNKAFVVNPLMGRKDASCKLAVLDYKVIGRSDGGYYIVEVELHTGRHHQIRAQLANIGCPIKGDLKYGAQRSNPDGGISLHARSITFVHPVRKEDVTIVAEPTDKCLII
ncbi:MAG: RluA family pseudouridine synthase [Bacteroidales bacterium]|nr:RluA family pseudouridine synthase [Bacteroidales bacterium]